MEQSSHRRRTTTRVAVLAGAIGSLLGGMAFAQGVPPHPPGDPTAPPQQPGAISSQQQKEHVAKEKKAAKEQAARETNRKADAERSRQAAAPSSDTSPTKPAPKPR